VRGGGARPCGACASCTLLRSDSHPDFHVVRLEEGCQADQGGPGARVDRRLTLKSYRGGFKVGIIEGAETLNTSGANAFLKTLEEPSADTMLMMIARPTHRLPATIASRCVRMVLRLRPRRSPIAWLKEHGGPG
jgi:DNA polymerase-3 subunit delta'